MHSKERNVSFHFATKENFITTVLTRIQLPLGVLLKSNTMDLTFTAMSNKLKVFQLMVTS